MRIHNLSNRKAENGITLLQVSLAVMVVGILLVPMIQIYKINQAERTRRENNKKLEDVAYALSRYAQQNHSFPIPAIPNLPSTDPNYGASAAPSALPCAALQGATGLICRSSPANTQNTNKDVLVGDVPYRQLGLAEKNMYDIYGFKIRYAVTRAQTDTASFSDNGTIAMLNQQGLPYDGGDDFNSRDVANNYRVQFLLISLGADGKGAYQKNGTQYAACTAGTGLDVENCDNTPTSQFFRGMQQLDPATPGALLPKISLSFMLGDDPTQHYDDMIVFRTTSHDEIWSGLRNSNSSEENAFLSQPMKTAIRSPSTGALTTPEASLDVTGNVQAYQALTESICDYSDECFRVKNITGPAGSGSGAYNEGVKCGGYGAFTGFSPGVYTGDPSHNSLRTNQYIKRLPCAVDPKADPAGPLNTDLCPNGLKGWSSTGTPICAQ